jgi:hypothetical protein
MKLADVEHIRVDIDPDRKHAYNRDRRVRTA